MHNDDDDDDEYQPGIFSYFSNYYYFQIKADLKK